VEECWAGSSAWCFVILPRGECEFDDSRELADLFPDGELEFYWEFKEKVECGEVDAWFM
jgi:hypothetical protein